MHGKQCHTRGHEVLESGRCKSVRRVAKVLHSLQAYPPQVVQHVSQNHMDMVIFDKIRPLPCTVWTRKGLYHLSSFDLRAFIVHEYSFYGVAVRKSTILDSGAAAALNVKIFPKENL